VGDNARPSEFWQRPKIPGFLAVLEEKNISFVVLNESAGKEISQEKREQLEAVKRWFLTTGSGSNRSCGTDVYRHALETNTSYQLC
jgi:hypothetical protein